MKPDPEARRTPAAAVVGLLASALFTCFAVVTTQAKTIRAGSPWQDDPYDAIVSFTQFVVPALCVFIVLRALTGHGATRSAVRNAQLLRASALCAALVGMTVLADWAALLLRSDRPLWDHWTPWLVVALGVVSMAVVAHGVVLERAFRVTPWRAADLGEDWLADADRGLQRLGRRWPSLAPVSTPLASETTVRFIRRHLVPVALLLSLVAALGIVGALAVGEGWTNPWLIAWALFIETTSYFSFCMVANVLLVLVRRPPLSRSRRATELAVVSGCLAVGVAVALRDPLWRVLHRGEVDKVTQLWQLTGGAGLLVGLLVLPFAFVALRDGRASPDRDY
ncbi:MAG: hypothetical protein M3130_00310 [Actinomycetota bacterium]|nr:hypothetical protein [Actinomycetota bacterium]